MTDHFKTMDQYILENHDNRVFLVCGDSIRFLHWNKYFNMLPLRLGVDVIRFNDFSPNPVYESVVKGVSAFKESQCKLIIAVGGGSSIDVAKCIKLFANMDPSRKFFEQEIAANDIRLFAIPTTAGTGSEATRYAVIYYKEEKLSITHDSCIPSKVIMDPSVLKSLPLYQRKSTMLDTFCHAVESYWSINSNDRSKEYSRNALRLILKNKDAYLNNQENGNKNMLQAANIAGKAINITQTTAGHAMCYKLTELYHIPHGFSAALCVSKLWPYMLMHPEDCIDPRGKDYLQHTFQELAKAMECTNAEDASKLFDQILLSLQMEKPVLTDDTDYNILRSSVNAVRLKNNPVHLDDRSIDILYHKILN